jgi:hypothetical protein
VNHWDRRALLKVAASFAMSGCSASSDDPVRLAQSFAMQSAALAG